MPLNESIQALLRRYKLEKRVVEIQTYLDPESTVLGFIHQIGDEFVCVIELDEDGSYDGVVVFRWDTIFFMRAGNSELEAIGKLAIESDCVPTLGIFDLSSMVGVIKDFNSVLGYVVLHLERVDEEQCYVGTVKTAGDIILLDEYSPLDEPQRSEVMLRSSDVSRVGHGGKYEEDLLKRFKKGPVLNVVKKPD